MDEGHALDAQYEMQVDELTRQPRQHECAYRLHFTGSQICVSPLLVPTAKYAPRWDQATEHTVSLGPKSYSLVTLLVQALHR